MKLGKKGRKENEEEQRQQHKPYDDKYEGKWNPFIKIADRENKRIIFTQSEYSFITSTYEFVRACMRI